MVRVAAFPTANEAWRALAGEVSSYGSLISPRGMLTRDIAHASLSFEMRSPVMACRERKLSYTFMAAEPLWYLDGSDDLEAIAKYNPRMREFSDDGKTLYGAYGPPIVGQLDYVLGSLVADRDTRQAWLTIWRRSPEPSKDIPCTIGIGWRIVANQLNCHVVMRSSDVYLGVPYDWFSFSILSAWIACEYNGLRGRQTGAEFTPHDRISLGRLFYSAASSHIYDRDAEHVRQCLSRAAWQPGPEINATWIASGDFDKISSGLQARRDGLTPEPDEFDPRPKWRTKSESPRVLSEDCPRCSGA